MNRRINGTHRLINGPGPGTAARPPLPKSGRERSSLHVNTSVKLESHEHLKIIEIAGLFSESCLEAHFQGLYEVITLPQESE